MAKVGAVVLAAGCSARFGTSNKLLAKIGDQLLIQSVLETISRVDSIAESLVVTGFDHLAIERALGDMSVRYASNPNWRNGMGSSIAVGISGLSATLQGALIVPGDMPLLTVDLIEDLISKFNESRGQSIVYPVTPSAEQRNPVLWPRHHFPLLQSLRGPDGGKPLLALLSESCVAVPVADERQLLDIDEPRALEAMERR